MSEQAKTFRVVVPDGPGTLRHALFRERVQHGDQRAAELQERLREQDSDELLAETRSAVARLLSGDGNGND